MDENYSQYYQMINAQQQANNEWSAQQAQKAMDYQTEMSNTAHQREVADLKAAGLNPVLSAGGQGATTGSGHAAAAGDGNVTALYGLLSKQIDAQTKQAEALSNAAKSISGSKGSASRSDSGTFNFAEGSWQNALWSTAQDLLKRKYGISYESSDAILNALASFGVFDGSEMGIDSLMGSIYQFVNNPYAVNDYAKALSDKEKSSKLTAKIRMDKEKDALRFREKQIRDNNYKIPFYMAEDASQLSNLDLASGLLFKDMVKQIKHEFDKRSGAAGKKGFSRKAFD